MNTTLKPDNPLYDDYQNITNRFYTDLPHQSYLEKYIVKKFFAWAEDYLEAMIIVHQNLIVSYKKEEEDKTQVIELVQDKLNYFIKKKREIEPFTIKISDFNNQIFKSEKLEEHYAVFNKDNNLIKLKPEEEIILQSGFFKNYLKQVFEDLMVSIEEFYLNNKDNFLDTLNICFKELDEFKTDDSRLKKLFKNEPNIYYKKINIEEFKFLTNQKWTILSDFISEKRILCEHYSINKYKNRNKEIILKIFNSLDSYDEFKWIADELNVNFNDIDKRGNAVKLFAIFDSSKTEHLFKKNITKIEYADTLIEIYKSKKLNPKNHSDTSKQVDYIDDIYSSRNYSK